MLLNKDEWLRRETDVDRWLKNSNTTDGLNFTLAFNQQILMPLVQATARNPNTKLPSIYSVEVVNEKTPSYQEMAQEYIWKQLYRNDPYSKWNGPIEKRRSLLIINLKSELYQLIQEYYGFEKTDIFTQKNDQWLRIHVTSDLLKKGGLDNCFWAAPEVTKAVFNNVFPDFYNKLNLEANFNKH